MNRHQILQVFKDAPFFLYHIFISVVLILMFQEVWWQRLNYKVADLMHPYISASPDIVLVKVDTKTLQKINDPYEPTTLAKVVTNLAQGGARVIGIDHLFPTNPLNGSVLRQAIKRADIPVVLPAQLSEGTLIRNNLSDHFGYFSSTSSPSSEVIRQSDLTVTLSNTANCIPSFTLSVVAHSQADQRPIACDDKVQLPNGVRVPNNFPFRLTQENFSSLSYLDVLNKTYDSSILKNKTVLLGSTAPVPNSTEQSFAFSTTLDGRILPRLEIRSLVANSLLQHKYLMTLPPLFVYGALVFATQLLLFAGRLINRASRISLFYAGFMFLVAGIGIVLSRFGYEWDFIGTVVLLLNTYIYILLYRHVTMQKYNNFIHTVFSHYIHPQRLNELMLNPEKLQLGGEQRVVTVMFVDIRNYTGLSEKLTPRQLVGFTNRYLDIMSQIIIKNGGTIDKFIGDSIMCFWNAPILDPEHRRKAISSAMEMVSRVEVINNDYTEVGDLRIGIGINTGPVIVGNVGGKNRFDYTVLGDNVNLTHRLQGLSKFYGVPIITTRPIPWKVDIPNIIFRILDKVTVKGRRKPCVLHQPLVDTPENIILRDAYEEAWLQYQDGNFRKAERIFDELPDDPPAQLMLKRIRELKKRKDLELWNGIWEWSEK